MWKFQQYDSFSETFDLTKFLQKNRGGKILLISTLWILWYWNFNTLKSVSEYIFFVNVSKQLRLSEIFFLKNYEIIWLFSDCKQTARTAWQPSVDTYFAVS